LILMVGRVGIEPTTNGLRERGARSWSRSQNVPFVLQSIAFVTSSAV
jgi:hypothetical protein